MIKAVATIGACAILAGLISILPAPRVEAGTSQADRAAATSLRPQPADTAAARPAACAQRAWPYYQQDCLSDFDARWRGEPRKVRLVTTDRLN